LPEAEAEMWLIMPEQHRARAIQRMAVLTRWIDSKTAWPVESAAADAGVSVTRFYEMAKAWRERPSLSALGAFANAPRSRTSRFDTALRRAVGRVVDSDPKGSVRKLALALAEASGLTEDEMPSHNTLRLFVEEELRRRQREAEAGNDVMLDCSACSMMRADGTAYTLFAILDRATQVVLGAALGDVRDSRGGYARAADDALARLDRGGFEGLPWAARTVRLEVVVGLDLDRWSDVKERLRNAGVSAPIEPATAAKRFGRYFRLLTGLRIGRVVLSPAQTGLVSDNGGFQEAEADDDARLGVEVNDYNAGRLAGFVSSQSARPPEELLSTLRFFSSAGSA
jgi:hypothetical protein